MKTLINATFLILLTGAFLFAQEAKPTTSTLGWMTGCWELNIAASKMTIAEHWMKPAGGSMIGMSRTVKGESTLMFEFLRIAEKPDGIFYIARPSSAGATANEETAFKLVKWGKAEAVFENLAHDFPQRIIYRSDKADSLFARVESADSKKGMDIPMSRARCE
jgi:hypothetical protein